ncbi:MAG: histidine phosphatase family protein [Chloroflexota bacterium]
MTDLLFVRHAHAGNALGWNGPDDLRPLTAKGLRQATRLGNLLAAADIHPDVLLSSARLRAVQTAEVLGATLGSPVQVDARLAGGLSMEYLRQIIEEASGAGQLMLVGHDPDFSDLATELVGAPIAVRKGALIRIEVEGGTVAPGAGILRWLIPPEALG